jgi:short-subunit dehydrogenase
VPIQIEGSNVLLTGATGGIGRAIARELHKRGARLVLSGRRIELLDQLQAELGEGVEVASADLGDPNDVQRLIDLDDFDVLVANAALPASGRFDSFEPDEIDRALDVNLRAPMQMVRAMAPRMVERGRGHIVLVSSLSGKVPSPGGAVYSATKFGLRGFGFAVNEDLHGSGVGVTTIFPGFIRGAGMFHDSGIKLPAGVPTRVPEDVARAVARGIERGTAEIDVAGISLRAGGWFFNIAPGIVGAIQRKLGGAALTRRISEGQKAKR